LAVAKPQRRPQQRHSRVQRDLRARRDKPDSRVTQASRDSRVIQARPAPLDRPETKAGQDQKASPVKRVRLDNKAIPAVEDKKAKLAKPDKQRLAQQDSIATPSKVREK
jgi:hypothetical protein